MAGLIAQEIALRARDRVLTLALMCSFERGRQAARLTPDILWIGLRTRIGSRAMRRQAFMEMILPGAYLAGADRPALGSQLATLFGHDLADQPAIVMKQLGAAARYDASGRLQELAGLPTLVLSARHDRIALPQYGRALADADPRRALHRDRGRRARGDDSMRERGQCGPRGASRGEGQSRRTGERVNGLTPLRRCQPGLKTRPPHLISPDAFSVGPGLQTPGLRSRNPPEVQCDLEPASRA